MKDICPLHCPSWIKWLFVIFALWFTLSAFGIRVYGSYWSWLILLSGLCAWTCASNKRHRKSSCWFAGMPSWVGIVITLIGAWFLLSDFNMLSTLGIRLLHLMTLILAIWVATE